MGLGNVLKSVTSIAAPVLGGIFGGPAGAAIGGAAGNLLSGSGAINDASNTQTNAGNLSIEEMRRQFDVYQKLLEPYLNAGTGALGAQQNLIGLNGNGAQQSAIDSIANGPQMQAYLQQGENALRQNASATGGLRGGNLQAALAQFRPELLAQLIDQQYGRLGGLSSMGQNSAVGVGNAGMQTGNNIAGQYGQIGAANAGNSLGQGNLIGNLTSGLAKLFSSNQGSADLNQIVRAF